MLCLAFSSNVSSQHTTKADSLKALLSPQLNDSNKVVLLGKLSDWFYEQEDYLNAIHYQLQKTQLLKKNKDEAHHASANEKLALMYYHIGNYELSAKHYLEALKYFEKIEDERMMAQISGNLANVYTRIDNYKNAISYLNKAKEILEKEQFFSSRTMAGLYTNIGLAYTGLMQLDSALLYYNKALNLINKTENALYFASILNNMGEVYYEQKEYEKALADYEKSYVLFSEIENYNGMGASKLNIAKIKIQQKKYTEAIILSKEALKILEEINSLFFVVTAHQQLYEAYKGLNDYKNANLHLEHYLFKKDSLKGNEKTEYISNLEMQYAAEKEQQKIQLLEQKIQLLEQKIQLLEQEKLLKEQELVIKETRFYIVIVSISALLFLTVLIIFYLKSNLQKNKLNQLLLQQKQEKLELSLNYKQKELESFANYLKEKNQLLENLKKELANTNLPDNGTAVKKLTGIINQYLHIDNDRKNLELKIDQEHQEFVQRLQEKYPQLTSNDIRLCSLILLDLNNKEMATILNIEPSSVKMSKNRLRKKLQLSKEENLHGFLKSL
jgi:tetratricopeptide (TPR) repeat protein